MYVISKTWRIFALFVLVGLTGCDNANDSATAADRSVGADVEVVRVVIPQRTSLRRTTTQPATVHAYYEADINAKVSGYLKELKVDIGAVVEEGEILAVIDVPEFVARRNRQQATVERLVADEQRARAGVELAQAGVEAANAAQDEAGATVEMAKAQVAAYQAEFNRVQRLVSESAVAARLLDEAREHLQSSQAGKQATEAALASAMANVTVAKAKVLAATADLLSARASTQESKREIEETEVMLAYSTLRAPFSGVITERNVDPGDLVRNTQTASTSPVKPLFRIAHVQRVRVRVSIPENDASWANINDRAIVNLRSLPGQPIEGIVSRVARSLDVSTRTMSVEIDLPNSDPVLLPGMYGEVTIILEEKPDCLVLPSTAVRYDETGRSYVLLVDAGDVIQTVDVMTGLDDGKRVEIISGLSGTERVVGATIQRLVPGQKVRVQ